MLKLRLQISVLVLLVICINAIGQNNYPLHIRSVDKDSAFLISMLDVKTTFTTRNECVNYINQLPGYLQSKGYVTASLDTIHYDSAFARIVLYAGDRYAWTQLDASQIDPSVLQAIGWRNKIFADKPMDFLEVKQWQEKILGYMENNGHPFAKVYLDSLQLDSGKVWAQLKLEKGPSYKIDSIRILGEVKIANEFLQRYLDIRNGSLFNKEKLLRVSKRMRELTYVEEEYPSKLVWLGTG